MKIIYVLVSLLIAQTSAQTNTIVIDKADLPPSPQFSIEVASSTLENVSTGQISGKSTHSEAESTHLTYPDDRLRGEDKEKYPVTIDTRWSVEEIKAIAGQAKHAATITAMTECESQFVSIKRLDANGKYSYGPLQYQSSTWAWMSKKAGVVGDPMNPNDAIKVVDVALDDGLGYHWTCYKQNEKNKTVTK